MTPLSHETRFLGGEEAAVVLSVTPRFNEVISDDADLFGVYCDGPRHRGKKVEAVAQFGLASNGQWMVPLFSGLHVTTVVAHGHVTHTLRCPYKPCSLNATMRDERLQQIFNALAAQGVWRVPLAALVATLSRVRPPSGG